MNLKLKVLLFAAWFYAIGVINTARDGVDNAALLGICGLIGAAILTWLRED